MSFLIKYNEFYKPNKADEYIKLYSELFNEPDKIKNVLEIGIFRGNSLRMWRDYFVNANIFGIDNVIKNLVLDEKRIQSDLVDQSSRGSMEKYSKYLTSEGIMFDIILDDGSHQIKDQLSSIGYLFKHLKVGGYYIVEDMNTSFDGKYLCGLNTDNANTTYNTFMILSALNILDNIYIPKEMHKLIQTSVKSSVHSFGDKSKKSVGILKKIK